MEQLDRDAVNSHALVIDGNPTSRSVLIQHLREFGVGSVKFASRIVEAREMLEKRRFDIVLCDHRFEQSGESGQDLLEEMRRERMLPYSTVFVMLTGVATYQEVAEAAEAALDSYLIKPFSANTLFERLREARQRKRVLKDIFEAIEEGNHELGAGLCLRRFEGRDQYWLYAARIGAELLLTLKRTAEARRLFDAVIAAKAVPWARLGVARALLADNELSQARRTLETLIGDMPDYADSYDVLGRVQMEQGQIADAMATYRIAAGITPGCILRLQHCGMLAFFVGDTVNALQMLERTWIVGSKSRLYDLQSMVLLAFLRFDVRDSKGLDQACDVLNKFAADHPQSERLRRMAGLGSMLMDLLQGRVAEAVARARELAGEVGEPGFDIETASNLLSLWSRIDHSGIEAPEAIEIGWRVGLRFSISKAATEVLVASTLRRPEIGTEVRRAQVEIMKQAEEAMAMVVQGRPQLAVQMLLDRGEQMRNAKLIETGGLVAQRHRDRIGDVKALLERAEALAHRYCSAKPRLVGLNAGNRSPGGLVIRR